MFRAESGFPSGWSVSLFGDMGKVIMRRINLLITGVGRRIELIQAFREAALLLGVDLKIYGADFAGTAPALAYCDYSRKVCGMREAGYIDELLSVCVEDEIDVVLPTIDTDLLVLAENRERFEKRGVRVVVSSPDMVRVCRDKNNTSGFFESCGLHAPKTYSDWEEYPGPFPCFIKPKDGSSSINAFKVENRDELREYSTRVVDYVIQPFIAGTEYTVDIFCDFEGNPIYITPRVRMAVRAGEVLKTCISLDDAIIGECEDLVSAFKPCGPMTVQLIRDDVTGMDYFIEINPRFGGGAPLSMKAGACSARALLELALDREVSIVHGTSDGAIYSRFDQSVCVDVGEDKRPLRGVVFDLDDTLYPERSYVMSGYWAIEELLGIDGIANELWLAFLDGEPALDVALGRRGLIGRKGECLDEYRCHVPRIALYDGVIAMIRDLRSKGIKVGVITDGRPEGQRTKLQALGLIGEVDDVLITDEIGGVQFRKPNDISFRIMQRRWRIPFEEMAYVGDNLNKDFQAPRQLGMKWLYFKNEEGLYSHDCEISGVSSVSEMRRALEKWVEPY